MIRLKELSKKKRRIKVIKYLINANPEDLQKKSERNLLKIFKRTAARVPAYKEILKKVGIDYKKDIRNINDFVKKVPIIDKNTVFPKYKINELCLDGSINNMKSVFSSSGFSGIYSFGINTKQNFKNISDSIDTSLEYLFNISKKKTFLVSCIPMGVKIHTSLTIAETSIRSDMAIAIIKKFSGYFDQLLVVGDPYFIKKIVEEGIEENIDWKRLNTSFIFGEDWFSETFRSYIENLVQINPGLDDKRLVMATLGIAELDLNLFHESIFSIIIRKMAQKNNQLRGELFGKDTIACPILFHYFPYRTYLETNYQNELIFSMLSPNLILPLIRYNSKDLGNTYTYNYIESILKKYNLCELIPDIKLPLVSVGGRNNRYINYKGYKITPEIINLGIFDNYNSARLTTGYFRLSQGKDRPIVEIQLTKNIKINNKIQNLMTEQVNKFLPIEIPVVIYSYKKYPYSMELDYERKFKFL